MRPRRLLEISTIAWTLEAFLLPFATHFREAGWEVDAFATGATGSPGVVEAFSRANKAPWARDPAAIAANARGVAAVRRLLPRYDLVHVHTPVAAFLTRVAAGSLGRRRPRIVYTAHGFHFGVGATRTKRESMYLGLERIAGRWTDALVVINERDLEQARALRLAPRGMVRKIDGIGVPTDVYDRSAIASGDVDKLRAELDLAADARLVVMIGEFNPEKRHEDVIEALAKLPSTVVVGFIGAGPREPEIRALAARYGVADRTRFLGFRTDVPALLAAADASVLPSSREGLPRSILEAQAMGVSVVASDIRGNSDLLREDRGFLYPLGNADALARELARALDDTSEARLRVDRATAALGPYTETEVLAAYERLFDEVLVRR